MFTSFTNKHNSLDNWTDTSQDKSRVNEMGLSFNVVVDCPFTAIFVSFCLQCNLIKSYMCLYLHFITPLLSKQDNFLFCPQKGQPLILFFLLRFNCKSGHMLSFILLTGSVSTVASPGVNSDKWHQGKSLQYMKNQFETYWFNYVITMLFNHRSHEIKTFDYFLL